MLDSSSLARDASLVCYESIDSKSVDAVKKAMLDWLGVAVRGAAGDVGMLMQRGLNHESGSVPLIGLPRNATPLAAALINGTNGHALDFDDTHEPSLLHASAAVWPAILASISDQTPGRDLICAFAAGVRTATRIATPVGPELSRKGFHVTGTVGHLAAGVAAGRILGLDPAKMEAALGIAATQAAGLTASFGTMCKPFHAGKAAMDGLLAARLAYEGFTGPGQVLERPDGFFATLGVSPAEEGVGEAWPDTGLSVKPYPSCLLTHAVIEACMSLRDKVGQVHSIETIELQVPPLAIKLAANPAPRSGLAGKFSIQYCAARTFVSGDPGPDDFVDTAIDEPPVRDLMARVILIPNETFAATAALATVQTTGGESFSAHVANAHGATGHEFTYEEVAAKFERLVAGVLTPAASAEIIRLVDVLDTESQVQALVRLTQPTQPW